MGGAPPPSTGLKREVDCGDVSHGVLMRTRLCPLPRLNDGACCPFALVNLAPGERCPIGSVFNTSNTQSVVTPWKPYPISAQPKQITFGGNKRSLLNPLCSGDDKQALSNTAELNTQLASLLPGDTHHS